MTTSCLWGIGDEQVARFQLTSPSFGLVHDGILHRSQMCRNIRGVCDELPVGVEQGAREAEVRGVSRTAGTHSKRSLIETETAVFCKDRHICSAIPMNRWLKMESWIGSTLSTLISFFGPSPTSMLASAPLGCNTYMTWDLRIFALFCG